MQRIVDVQERLKTDLLEQLNEIPCNEFENFELKIERLDEIPVELRRPRRRASQEFPRLTVGRRNRGVKMMKGVIKYKMEELFKVKVEKNSKKRR